MRAAYREASSTGGAAKMRLAAMEKFLTDWRSEVLATPEADGLRTEARQKVSALRIEHDKAVTNQAEWAAWQERMLSAYQKAEGAGGGASSRLAAWDSFLSSYPQSNPYSDEAERLRTSAKSRMVALRAEIDAADRDAKRKDSGKITAQTPPGTVFRDCADCPEMVVIPAGSFMMGSYDGSTDEQPVHQVTISRPLAVGKYEVTQAEWASVMGTKPRRTTACRASTIWWSWR